MTSNCELIDLEDLLGHKGFQWFLDRAVREWGSEAVMSRIESVQNRLDIDDATRKEQVNQILVARKAVNMMLTELDREIKRRRGLIHEQHAAGELAAERRGGT